MPRKNDLSKQLEKRLKEVERGAKEINDAGAVDFEDLFNRNFMTKYTSSASISEFFDNSPFEFETQEEFEKIDEGQLDIYVRQQSKFGSWSDMASTAGTEYMAKKLGF